MDGLDVYNTASLILGWAAAALEETPQGCPDRRVVMIGDLAAWDNCCDGQLTVVVTQVFPSTTFPAPDQRIQNCGAPFTAMNVDVEIVRCGPTMDHQGNAPSVASLDSWARLVHHDARTIRWNVRCALNQNRRLYDAIERQQLFLNDGACGGSRLSLTIGMRDG